MAVAWHRYSAVLNLFAVDAQTHIYISRIQEAASRRALAKSTDDMNAIGVCLRKQAAVGAPTLERMHKKLLWHCVCYKVADAHCIVLTCAEIAHVPP